MGLPRFCLDGLRRIAARQGLLLDAHSLHLRALRALVARGVSLYHPEDPLTPAVRARDVRVRLDPWHGLRGGEWIRALELAGTTVRDPSTAADAPLATAFRDLRFRMEMGADGFTFSDIAFRFQGLELAGDGTYRARERGPEAPRPRGAGTVPSLREIQREMRRIEPVLNTLAGIAFQSPPRLTCRFSVDEGRPEATAIEVWCDYADGAVYQGQRFQELRFRAQFLNETLRLSGLQLTAPGGYARATLAFDARLRLTMAEAALDLAADQVATLLPPEVAEVLREEEIELDGRLRGRLSFHAPRVPEGGRHLQAEVKAESARWRGIRLAGFDGEVEIGPAHFAAQVRESGLGEGPQAGRLSGRVRVDRREKSFSGEVEASGSPRAVLAAAREVEEVQRVLAMVECRGPPVRARVRFSGRNGSERDLRLEGELSGERLVVRGVPLDTAAVSFAYTNRVLRLENLHATRGGESVAGNLALAHSPRQLDLDVTSTLSPAELAPILGPSFEAAIAPFRLTPPLSVRLLGAIDLQHGRDHRLYGELAARAVAWRRFEAEQALARFTLTGNLLTLPLAEGVVDGGACRALVQVAGLDQRTNRTFFVAAEAHQVALDAFLPRLGVQVGERALGRLTGRATVSGPAHREWPDTLVGTGAVELREGRLFEVPFFGDFSKLLSLLIPGFGYAQQTDLTASFRIGNRQVALADVRLLGNVLSAFGEGTVDWDGRLKMNIQVKLLREGLVARAVQVLSWPLTKLFEIRLHGTLRAPEWRPENLPKELFLKFD
jgi:hypothetical protein